MSRSLSWAATALLSLLFAAPPAQAQPTKVANEYRTLRDNLRQGRMKTVDMRTRVVSIISEGRYQLDLTAADFAQSGMPTDYPVTLVAGTTRTTARFLSAEQVRIRDAYALEIGAGVSMPTEVRLVVDNTNANRAKPIVLDAWSAGQLFPLALRPGDTVTIKSVKPIGKGS